MVIRTVFQVRNQSCTADTQLKSSIIAFFLETGYRLGKWHIFFEISFKQSNPGEYEATPASCTKSRKQQMTWTSQLQVSLVLLKKIRFSRSLNSKRGSSCAVTRTQTNAWFSSNCFSIHYEIHDGVFFHSVTRQLGSLSWCLWMCCCSMLYDRFAELAWSIYPR